MRKLALWTLALVLAACGEVVQQPPDPDPCASGGTCECTVATQDADCGAHQFCNVSDTGRTCDCVAGYTDGVNGCVWTGAVQDPGFASATAWTPANGALLNATAVGAVDPGEVSFLPSSLCTLGHVTQMVTMPTFEKSEPLVLELSYKNGVDFQNFDRALMGVGFGDSWSPFPNYSDANFHSVRICLPAGAYAPSGTPGAGAPVPFAFGPYQQPDRCPNSTVTAFAVDHAAIVKANAGECGTRFGEGINFDAEGTGGWTFTVSGGSTGGFAAGAGVGNSRAARINLAQRCDSAVMQTTINVPAVANPAFEMFVSAGPGANPSLSFSTLFSTSVFPTTMPVAQNRTFHMCMPPTLRGQTVGLSLSVSGGSGLCSDTLNLQVSADNARVVDDPACASTDGLPSPGFEQGGAPWGAYYFVGSSTANVAISVLRSGPEEGSRSGLSDGP